MTRLTLSRPVRRAQTGVATLAVVMVLFFIIAMTAAYTSRNMIFEQKTAANQYRSTLAIEAAEAGIEWALAMLNGGLIDASCTPDNTSATSFQQRYLQITNDLTSANNGRVLNRAGRPVADANMWPACAFDGTRWNNPQHCACPIDAAALPVGPAGTDFYPAFRVWLGDPTAPTQLVPRPGVVALQSNGCTKLPTGAEQCLNRNAQGDFGDGLSSLRVLLALRSGLAVPPSAAVTAREGVTADDTPLTNPKLRVVNLDLLTNGITVNAGGAANETQITALSLPGVPGETTVVEGDSKLAGLATVAVGGLSASERMFVAQFGATRQTYLEQPGLRRCPTPGAVACTAADINTLQAQNPGRIIWVQGDLTLDADIGSIAAPVLLVVDGTTLTLGSGVDITGFIYITGRTVAGVANPVTVNLPDGATSITGALVAETSLSTDYAGAPIAGDELTVTYHPGVLNTLRTGYGSWVRVPGSWRDFRE